MILDILIQGAAPLGRPWFAVPDPEPADRLDDGVELGRTMTGRLGEMLGKGQVIEVMKELGRSLTEKSDDRLAQVCWPVITKPPYIEQSSLGSHLIDS